MTIVGVYHQWIHGGLVGVGDVCEVVGSRNTGFLESGKLVRKEVTRRKKTRPQPSPIKTSPSTQPGIATASWCGEHGKYRYSEVIARKECRMG